MIDKFCNPVLLYGLEALENKLFSIKAIHFVYTSDFLNCLISKKNNNILYCQHATSCLPAACKLELHFLGSHTEGEHRQPTCLYVFYVVWL